MALRASTPRTLGINLLVVVLCVGAVFGLGADGRAVLEAVEEHLRIRVEAIQDGAPGAASVGEEPILARDGVARYYRRTAFEPVWARSAGPTVLADSLRAVLRDADRDGLRPADYHGGSSTCFQHPRRDVYDRDAALRSALNAPPHSPTGGSATN